MAGLARRSSDKEGPSKGDKSTDRVGLTKLEVAGLVGMSCSKAEAVSTSSSLLGVGVAQSGSDSAGTMGSEWLATINLLRAERGGASVQAGVSDILGGGPGGTGSYRV